MGGELMQRSIFSFAFYSVLCMASLGHAGFGELNPRFDFVFGDSGGMPDDVVDTTGQQTSPDGKSVKLFGTMGPLDGARFRNGFVFYFDGVLEGPLNIANSFLVDMDFSAQVTGGEMTWRFYSVLWTGEWVRASTDMMALPSGIMQSLHLESTPLNSAVASGQFSGFLHVDWTGFSPTDTFTITIPENSIDFTVVPEPSAMLLMIAALMASTSTRKFSW